MYVPPSFRVDDPETLRSFMRRYSFATVVTSDEEAVPFASHLPMLYSPERGPNGTLVAHMARANPQWRHFVSGRQALAIFSGPHAYVSPSWYEISPAVPTWNYAVVHAYGVASVVESRERTIQILEETIAENERHRTRLWDGTLPADYRDSLVGAIVAFEIPVDRIEGKFKLSQNRSEADQQGVRVALAASDAAEARALAALMTSRSADLTVPRT